jgi:sigma-E factor negative regulatory protein RseB
MRHRAALGLLAAGWSLTAAAADPADWLAQMS